MADAMMCPVCGVAMNHHADKMVYGDSGEAMEEFHSCPTCGTTESRAAQ